MAKIEDILAKRDDLSGVLVHLTRKAGGKSAADNLDSILKGRKIEARSPFGQAHQRLAKDNCGQAALDSQKCVCFTETPLRHVLLMAQPIEGRTCQFEPYGIAITRKRGREHDVNPVWYVDITSRGRPWLTGYVDQMIEADIQKFGANYSDSPSAKIAPFVETMGSGKRSADQTLYRKEFWWEREWRHIGDFNLSFGLLVLCPSADFPRFNAVLQKQGLSNSSACVDPMWNDHAINAAMPTHFASEVLAI